MTYWQAFLKVRQVFYVIGIYKHIDNTTVVEPSICILLYDVEIATVEEFARKVKVILNQESVLIENSQANMFFY